jgi:iron complex outermembrane receptor protein
MRAHPIATFTWVALSLAAATAHAGEAASPSAPPTPEVQEIEVRGDGAPASVAAPSRNVSGESVERTTHPSLLEAVAEQTPGMYVSSRGAFAGVSFGAAGGMRLRGLGGSPNTELLILDDGVPDMMGLFGHPIPDSYLPAYVAGVDVTPGADSVLFGNGAMGGVVRIRTRWGAPDSSELRVHGEYGSYQTTVLQPGFLGSFGGAGGVGGVDVLAGARAVHSDGHRDFTDGDELGTVVKVRVHLRDDVDVTLRQRTLIAHTFDPGPTSRPFYGHFVDFDRFNQSLTIHHAEGALEGRFSLYGNVGLHRLFDGFRSVDSLFGAWLEETAHVGDEGLLLFGVDARSIGGSAKNIVTYEDDGTHRQSLVDPYAQASWRFWKRLTLVAGGRVHVSERAPIALGKLGFDFALPGSLRIAGRWAEGYRDPTIVERFLPFPVANPELKSERSTTTELTLGWHPRRDVLLELTGFRTDARDYIRTLGAYPDYQRQNLASVRLYGLEALARARLFGPISVLATASVMDVGPYTAQTPSRTASGSVVYDDGKNRVALSGTVAGGLYQKDFRQSPLDAPWSIDARVDHVFDGHVRAWIVARNLTNHRYAFIQDYVMPGFNTMIGLEMIR